MSDVKLLWGFFFSSLPRSLSFVGVTFRMKPFLINYAHFVVLACGLGFAFVNWVLATWVIPPRWSCATFSVTLQLCQEWLTLAVCSDHFSRAVTLLLNRGGWMLCFSQEFVYLCSLLVYWPLLAWLLYRFPSHYKLLPWWWGQFLYYYDCLNI